MQHNGSTFGNCVNFFGTVQTKWEEKTACCHTCISYVWSIKYTLSWSLEFPGENFPCFCLIFRTGWTKWLYFLFLCSERTTQSSSQLDDDSISLLRLIFQERDWIQNARCLCVIIFFFLLWTQQTYLKITDSVRKALDSDNCQHLSGWDACVTVNSKISPSFTQTFPHCPLLPVFVGLFLTSGCSIFHFHYSYFLTYMNQCQTVFSVGWTWLHWVCQRLWQEPHPKQHYAVRKDYTTTNLK